VAKLAAPATRFFRGGSIFVGRMGGSGRPSWASSASASSSDAFAVAAAGQPPAGQPPVTRAPQRPAAGPPPAEPDGATSAAAARAPRHEAGCAARRRRRPAGGGEEEAVVGGGGGGEGGVGMGGRFDWAARAGGLAGLLDLEGLQAERSVRCTVVALSCGRGAGMDGGRVGG
jgi:hypothetical protein